MKVSDPKTMTADDAADVVRGIEALDGGAFLSTRYPYTYAYDYMRSHNVTGDPHASRSDCAQWLRGNPAKDDICKVFADAYLREWKIRKP